jgi:ABC-2 type transport system permease protein
MNWEHMKAFLWLNSRLRANKAKRSSELSNTLHTIIMVLAVVSAIGAFIGSLVLSMRLLVKVPPSTVMYIWDGLVAAFLFFWIVTLSIELQRSELLPLEKFMHYPISVSGLFLINYVASILSEHVAVFLFIPAMLGLSVGLVFGRGFAMIWLFPLLAAFILMVTAVTYQFRGWLAVLMLNKRHRRSVITIVTVTTMLLFQLPYLSTRVFGSRRRGTPAITSREQVERIATQASMIAPPGWLPYGARASAEGRFLPPILGIAGMTLIGVFSLRRSYRTTVRLYTGNYGSGRTKAVRSGPSKVDLPKAAEPLVQVPNRGATSIIELTLPWVSEQTSAVASATFRSFTRAPESKMVLLSPLIMVFFFGASVSRWSSHSAEFTRPLIASGVLGMLFLSVNQLAMNHFAFDRSGFRNYVLASASRRDILLGKNLAMAPVALGLAGVVLTLLQWILPMRIDHFIAILFQTITMFLLFCMFGNFLSIVNPTAINAGSLRPAVRPSGKTILLGLLTFVLFPVVLAPSMIPLGLEYLVHWMGWYTGIPVFLLLSVVEVLALGYVYSWVLDREGAMLQSRELKILDVVAARVAES